MTEFQFDLSGQTQNIGATGRNFYRPLDIRQRAFLESKPEFDTGQHAEGVRTRRQIPAARVGASSILLASGSHQGVSDLGTRGCAVPGHPGQSVEKRRDRIVFAPLNEGRNRDLLNRELGQRNGKKNRGRAPNHLGKTAGPEPPGGRELRRLGPGANQNIRDF